MVPLNPFVTGDTLARVNQHDTNRLRFIIDESHLIPNIDAQFGRHDVRHGDAHIMHDSRSARFRDRRLICPRHIVAPRQQYDESYCHHGRMSLPIDDYGC